MTKRSPAARLFQFTLPAWGETGLRIQPHMTYDISIHSPRMGRDPPDAPAPPPPAYFNPLSPHGERHDLHQSFIQGINISIHSPRMGRDSLARINLPSDFVFQSTLPAWGETKISRAIMYFITKFQSTLPAWGETLSVGRRATNCRYFNPLSPHGERLNGEVSDIVTVGFQSTLPAWGET